MDKSLYFHQVLTHYFILFLNQKIPPKTRMAVENGRLHQIWPWKAVATKQDHSQPINFHRGTNGGPLHQHRSAALVHQEKSRDGGEYVDHTCWGIILGVSPLPAKKEKPKSTRNIWNLDWIKIRFLIFAGSIHQGLVLKYFHGHHVDATFRSAIFDALKVLFPAP